MDEHLKTKRRHESKHKRPMMNVWEETFEDNSKAINMLADRCTAIYALISTTYSQIALGYSNFYTKDNDKERAFFEVCALIRLCSYPHCQYLNRYVIGVLNQLFEQDWWPIAEREYFRFIKTEWFSKHHHRIQETAEHLMSPLLLIVKEAEDAVDSEDEDGEGKPAKYVIKDRPRTGPLVCMRALSANRPPPTRLGMRLGKERLEQEDMLQKLREKNKIPQRPASATASDYPKPRFDSDTISARARNVGNVPYRWRKMWSTKAVAEQELEKEWSRTMALTGKAPPLADLKKR
jgi:hypothetical protein